MYGCKNASASNYEPTAVNHNELLCMYNSGSPLPAPLPVPLPIPEKSKGYIFTRNLRSGMIGNDVKELQKYLNTNGYVLAKSGAGSPGNETTKFGRLTRTLLSAFQKGNNIKPPVGFFGPITRGFINNK
jgi:peptidoglycan hydrolase-like protein with peptidoglycan-binding domain